MSTARPLPQPPSYVQLLLPLDCGVFEGSPALRDIERMLARALKAACYIERKRLDACRFSIYYDRGKGYHVSKVSEDHDWEHGA